MRVTSSSLSYRRFAAAWLLTLAVVSPAAAGSGEPVRQAPAPSSAQSPVRVVADVTSSQAAVQARQGSDATQAAAKRDPRLNRDLAAFSRAF